MKPPDLTRPVLRFGLNAVTNPNAKIQSLVSPFRLLRAVSRVGAKGAAPVPYELLPMGARVLAQGYVNRVAITRLDGWLLPPWMRRQSDPASPLFVPRSVSNLMLNQTERSWTALGFPGAAHPVESIVDRYGLLTHIPGGPSLDWWAWVEGSDEGFMAPSQYQTVQRLQGGLPVIVTAFEAGGLRMSSEAWMLSLPGGDWAAMQVVLFNIADMPLRGKFRFALRPYNPEGISPIYNIEYRHGTLYADGRPGPITWPLPESWHLSGLRGGDLYNASAPPSESRQSRLSDPHGFAHGVLEYGFNIEPWEEAEFLALMPVFPRGRRVGGAGKKQTGGDNPVVPTPTWYSRAKATTTLRWRELLESGMRVSLPDRALQESLEANRSHLLALHDGETITPGPDLYHGFWFRDAAFMTHALSAYGFRKEAGQLLRGFVKRQRRDGSFISQSSEWDGTGQVLWATAKHLALHPDPALATDVRPAMKRGENWIVRTLARSGGLMPPGISSEHLGPPDRYYWDNLWALGGLVALQQLYGEGDNAGKDAAELLENTLNACFKKDAAANGGALTAAPGRPVDLGVIGTLAAWYPLDILPAASPFLRATLSAIAQKLFYQGALFVNTGHSGWGTYINMRIAGCYLLVDPEKGWELIRWLLRHASPTYNWPEAIHTTSGGGSTGDGHHGWASAEWLLLVRALLLREGCGELSITPAFPESWLTTAGSISVAAAPTSFGSLSYNIEWDDGGQTLCLDLEADWRSRPSSFKWHIPGVPANMDAVGIAVGANGTDIEIPADSRQLIIKRDPG